MMFCFQGQCLWKQANEVDRTARAVFYRVNLDKRRRTCVRFISDVDLSRAATPELYRA